MSNDIPTEKIKMMKASMRCLVFGLLSLVPVIGPAFALAAGWTAGQVRAKEKLFWNPARPQRIWGFACAAFGVVAWGWVDILFVYRVLNPTH